MYPDERDLLIKHYGVALDFWVRLVSLVELCAAECSVIQRNSSAKNIFCLYVFQNYATALRHKLEVLENCVALVKELPNNGKNCVALVKELPNNGGEMFKIIGDYPYFL